MSAPQNLKDLILHVQAQFPDLSPQFQAGARYLIDHPTQVSTLSARKLAVLAGVQPATLVRLAQHLGYAGWDALKAVFTRELHLRPGGYAARAQSLVEHPSPSQEVWHAAAQQQSRNILSLEAENSSAMQSAIDILFRSKRMLIAGFRSSYPAAFSLRYLCSLFRPDVYLLQDTGASLSLDLQHLQADDVMVLLAYAPYSREMAQVLQSAIAADCKIIAICDSQVAPIALQASCVLTFPTHGNSFFPSTVAMQSLVEMLAKQLLVRSGERAIARLSHSESLLHDSGAYIS